MHDSIVALFAGAGGLSAGFASAGLKPAIAIDIDEDACTTYYANLGVQSYRGDLANPDNQIRRLVSTHDAPLAVIGGPPCQGFSTAGGRNDNDPRNRLIFSYLDIVREIRPRWFLFENVEGILTSKQGESITSLIEQFILLGYYVRLEKINFASYGLPQSRKRVVILGNRMGLDFSLPVPTHSFDAGKHKSDKSMPPSPTLDSALSGLGTPLRNAVGRVPYPSPDPTNAYDAAMREGNSSNLISFHYWSGTDDEVEKIRLLKPGQTMKDLPEEHWHASFKRRAFRRVMDGTPTEKRGGAPSGLKRLKGDLNALTEPPRVCRRLFGLSHAAMAGSLSVS